MAAYTDQNTFFLEPENIVLEIKKYSFRFHVLHFSRPQKPPHPSFVPRSFIGTKTRLSFSMPFYVLNSFPKTITPSQKLVAQKEQNIELA